MATWIYFFLLLKDLIMRNLSYDELDRVSAGIWPFVIGSVISLASYAYNKNRRHEEMTVPGAATAMCFGAVTGGVGGMCAGAAGGGIVGNLAWRPGFLAINAAGQAIAVEQK